MMQINQSVILLIVRPHRWQRRYICHYCTRIYEDPIPYRNHIREECAAKPRDTEKTENSENTENTEPRKGGKSHGDPYIYVFIYLFIYLCMYVNNAIF